MTWFIFVSLNKQRNTQREGKKRQLFRCKPAKNWKHTHHTHTHTCRHCKQGLWECTTGICPKSEIIDAERMKQCKLIKDKNCLLLNRLRGDLIVLLCLWDSSGFWENAAQLLCWLSATLLHLTQGAWNADPITRYTNTHTLIINGKEWTGFHRRRQPK